MEQEINWFFHQLYLIFGILSLIVAGVNAYVLVRILVADWRYARYERECKEEIKNRPPIVEPTPEECARRHQELLDAGFTYDSCYGAYTKPARPDWEH